MTYQEEFEDAIKGSIKAKVIKKKEVEAISKYADKLVTGYKVETKKGRKKVGEDDKIYIPIESYGVPINIFKKLVLEPAGITADINAILNRNNLPEYYKKNERFVTPLMIDIILRITRGAGMEIFHKKGTMTLYEQIKLSNKTKKQA